MLFQTQHHIIECASCLLGIKCFESHNRSEAQWHEVHQSAAAVGQSGSTEQRSRSAGESVQILTNKQSDG